MNRKQTLDKFYTDTWTELINYTNKFIIKYNKKHLYSAEEILSEIYLILVNFKKWDEIICLKAITKQIIKNTIIFYNSEFNRKINKFNNNVDHIIDDELNNTIITQLINNNFITDGYENINIENVIDNFKNELTNHEKQIFLICFEQDNQTVKKISNHLKISKFYANEVKIEWLKIKEKFREYIKIITK